ncbi:hypothetical protein K438DRAFT_307066 [Mycena galopus ATCC 62051]|nr:hypothetical protein K438DRAFT_307066 [Mycena galopus ATCC 62051]
MIDWPFVAYDSDSLFTVFTFTFVQYAFSRCVYLNLVYLCNGSRWLIPVFPLWMPWSFFGIGVVWDFEKRKTPRLFLGEFSILPNRAPDGCLFALCWDS